MFSLQIVQADVCVETRSSICHQHKHPQGSRVRPISYLSHLKTKETVKYINSFIENLAALKYSMSTERQLDRTENIFFMFSEIIW